MISSYLPTLHILSSGDLKVIEMIQKRKTKNIIAINLQITNKCESIDHNLANPNHYKITLVRRYN